MNNSEWKIAEAARLAERVAKKLPANARAARRALRDLADLVGGDLVLEGYGGQDFVRLAASGERAVHLEVGHQCVSIGALRRRVPVELLTLALARVVDEDGGVEAFIRKRTEGWDRAYVEALLAEVGPPGHFGHEPETEIGR